MIADHVAESRSRIRAFAAQQIGIGCLQSLRSPGGPSQSGAQLRLRIGPDQIDVFYRTRLVDQQEQQLKEAQVGFELLGKLGGGAYFSWSHKEARNSGLRVIRLQR